MENINLQEINTILSDTLFKVVHRNISLKQATVIAKLASTLSKNIVNTELQEKVNLLEQVLKDRK